MTSDSKPTPRRPAQAPDKTKDLPANASGSPETQAAETVDAPAIGSVSDIFSGIGVENDAVGGASDPSTPDAAGQPQRIGEYELLQKIGEGGMGVVYLARQASADRTVALKVIRPDRIASSAASDSDSIVERFRTEARASAKLQHDNIVTIYDVGELDGQHYFSMRMVSGSSLAELLRGGPLENRRAARYLQGIARGMAHAHDSGVLHRDLKPQNVLIDAATDRPLITDFGLAKFTQSDSELTRHGEVVGTPAYMSPEQARDSGQVDQRADIYAIGATMYHLLTGRPPFQAASPLDTLNQVLTREPIAPRRLNPAIDRDLETICLKCLEKTPGSRYGSAGDVADELARYLEGLPIEARPLGPATRLIRWCRRKPLIASLISATAAAMLITIVALTLAYAFTSASQARSEASFRMALKTVNRFFTRVSEDILLDQPGMQIDRREMLGEALAFYQQFLQQRSDDPQLRHEVARTHFRIGVIIEQLESVGEAVPHFEHALRLQDDLAAGDARTEPALWLSDTWTALGRSYHKLGRWEEAEEAYVEALRIRSRLASATTDSPGVRRKLANSQMNLGLLHSDRRNYQVGIDFVSQAQTLRQRLLEEVEDAELRLSIRRDLAKGYYNWSQVLGSSGATADERIDRLSSGIEHFEQLAAQQPRDFRVRHLLGLCYRLRGDSLEDAALKVDAYERARLTLEPLATQNTEVTAYSRDLAVVYILAADLDAQQGNVPLAALKLRRAIAFLSPLATAAEQSASTERALINQQLEAAQTMLAQLQP